METSERHSSDRLQRSETYRKNILSDETVRVVVIPRLTEEYAYIIRPDDLDENGQFKDSYLEPEQSKWFGEGAAPNTLTGLNIFARLVVPTKGAGIETLQIHTRELDEPTKDRLSLLDPSTVAEFASLITNTKTEYKSIMAPFQLMGKMRNFSLDHGIRYWICGFVPQEEPHFTRLLGPSLEKLGDHPVGFGNFDVQCQPYLIDLEDGMKALHESGRTDPLHRRISALIDPQINEAAA